jgi:hypothetical protein
MARVLIVYVTAMQPLVITVLSLAVGVRAAPATLIGTGVPVTLIGTGVGTIGTGVTFTEPPLFPNSTVLSVSTLGPEPSEVVDLSSSVNYHFFTTRSLP